MKKAFAALLIGFVGSTAFAWGATGHQVIASVGSTTANQNQFWTANADGMRQLTTVPDRVWKGPQTKADEAPTHWFQADAYVPNLAQCNDILNFPKVYKDAVAKYTEATIIRNGTAPWRIVQMYNLALSDFRSGNQKMALEEAGAMSHYIGDLSMPLHVSENYDGQMTGQKGIHSWFETKNLGDENSIRAEVAIRTQKLLQDPAWLADAKGDLFDVLNHEIIRSLLKRDEVLNNDKKLGRTSPQAQKVQLDLAEDRMADGAAVLSVILGRLAADAKIPNNKSIVPIVDPQWIAPDFNSPAPSAPMSFMSAPVLAPGADDCAAEAADL